jgi:hypothetical protein
MQSDSKKLTNKHPQLTHSEYVRVLSHRQRDGKGDDREWIINTVMIEDCDTPFKFKRKQAYQNLKGARVNMTYYPAIETVAGLEMEIMTVVRIKKS